jgi:MFS family permease
MVAEKTGDTDGKRLALAASCAGIFLAVLRSTSANTALPEIRADLGGAVAGLQWVAGSYTLVLASLLLSVGALTDCPLRLPGRRRSVRFGATPCGLYLRWCISRWSRIVILLPEHAR